MFVCTYVCVFVSDLRCAPLVAWFLYTWVQQH